MAVPSTAVSMLVLRMATGLEFAPGTSNESKKIVGNLFTPTELFSAYRAARTRFGTGDLVLTVSEQDPSGFEATTRSQYIRNAKALLDGKPMPVLMRGLVDKSAQGIVNMPSSSDAMWLLVVRGPQAVPIMCVIYAIEYEAENAVAG